MGLHPQGVDRLFPALYLLELIEEQVELFLAVPDLLTYIVEQGMVRAEVLITQVFKIQKDDVRTVDLVTNLFQQDAFAATADAGQHLDDALADERLYFC